MVLGGLHQFPADIERLTDAFLVGKMQSYTAKGYVKYEESPRTGCSVPPSHGEEMMAVNDPQATAALVGGVALVAFSNESPHHSRGDVHMADVARMLRVGGVPSRVFHVHLTGADQEENGRRVERLVERVIGEGCKWVVFPEVWTPELGRQLQAAGIRLIEMRSHTFEDAIFSNEIDLLAHVKDCVTDRPLDELENLVEIVGPRDIRPITSIDLRVQQSCGYKGKVADNPFYRDVLDVPEAATHRGCAYCMSARPESSGTAEEIAARIVERIRCDRKIFPAVDTFWVAFAETFYDSLGIAFRTTRGDPLWQGITLAMQCRPDVIARRASEIEALAADAAACGTRLRIGVVGFENFSPPDILVLNRGAAPEALDAAASILNRWLLKTPPGLVVRGFIPSFILFTPWTRIEDLEFNLQRIFLHGLWDANIERLRIGPGTPAFAKAQRDGLVIDKRVRTAAHPNGYCSEREILFVDPRVAAISAGFERLRPLAMSELPELLNGVMKTVVAADDPAAIDWDTIARDWEDVGAAARAA